MNPLSNLIGKKSNLIGKKFKELTAAELMQVVQAFCDQNRYAFNYNFEFRTRKDVEEYFESNFHGLFELKSFFIYWTK